MMPSAQLAPDSEIARIADQLRRMYHGPAWHGPALQPLLDGVTEQQASARPLAKAHTIWELVLHITTWIRVARERLSATENVDPSADEDWPTPTGAWSDALRALDNEYGQLEQAIRAFPEERLHARAPGTEPQNFYILLHGAIQHIAYHAGQIALLKKGS
jgi:uncharacterized damage-inducible protein DinB